METTSGNTDQLVSLTFPFGEWQAIRHTTIAVIKETKALFPIQFKGYLI